METEDFEDVQLFEFLFEQAAVPLCVLKADPPVFTITALNDRFRETSQTPTGDAIGMSAFEVYKPYNEASVQQYKLLKEGLNEAMIHRRKVKLPVLHFESNRHEQAAPSWWQIEITPITSSDKKVKYLLCSTLNVTERELMRLEAKLAHEQEQKLQEELKTANEELSAANEELSAINEELSESQKQLATLNAQLEDRIVARTEALAASEKKFRSILDSMPLIAWTSNASGEVDFYNRQWYEYTGLGVEESRTAGWKKVIHPDDRQYNIDIYRSIVESKKSGEFEIRERGADGIYRWHLIRLRPFFTDPGVVNHWIGTATEIDTLKKLQEQKDDFINIASHELKTPLTTLKASLQLLDRMKHNPLSDKFRHIVDHANKSMYKMSTLVDDLLDTNRLRRADLSLNKKCFILSQLISGCCNHISLTAKHNLVVTGDMDVEVYADERAIDQVIVNLVNNAVKYAPDSKDITITIRRDADMVKVSVSDQGPGIPKDKLSFVFERYYRVQASNSHSPGLGLGLFICSEIIKKHGGEMGVESELGHGCTFWFTLPLAI